MEPSQTLFFVSQGQIDSAFATQNTKQWLNRRQQKEGVRDRDVQPTTVMPHPHHSFPHHPHLMRALRVIGSAGLLEVIYQ